MLRSVVTDVVVSGYLFSRFKILMPKRKARKSQFSVLALKLKTNGMKGCVPRGKGWLFQELTIPKNVAAYYEGKDGYFKKLVYQRT